MQIGIGLQLKAPRNQQSSGSNTESILLLEDAVSYLMLEDGTSSLLLEG